MSTHNICFCGEMRKILSGAVAHMAHLVLFLFVNVTLCLVLNR